MTRENVGRTLYHTVLENEDERVTAWSLQAGYYAVKVSTQNPRNKILAEGYITRADPKWADRNQSKCCWRGIGEQSR